MKLVKRLFVIDSKLNGETQELVKEYNEIIEDIWSMTLTDTSTDIKVRSKEKQ